MADNLVILSSCFIKALICVSHNLLKGILSEIDSICSSVGKKAGKKWAQFVSVAANKIWSSVGGKCNKKDKI